MTCEDEVLSEILIAQLLQEDLESLSSAKQAERLQLDQVFAASARLAGRIPKFSTPTASVAQDDGDFALAIYAEDARVSSDAALAQRVQASTLADMHYAQRVAAAEKKLMLDSEFARRLQAVDDEGQDTDKIQDAESLLGQDTVERIMASDLNEKGKGKSELNSDDRISVKRAELDQNVGKGKGKRWEIDDTVDQRAGKHLRMIHGEDVEIKQESMEGIIEAAYATCGICMDAFQPTYSPYTASLSANSSSRVQFGLRLPCPEQHAYCVGCLTSYIESKLDPDGKGAGNSGIIVFPIRCPECPITDFMDGIADEIAARVLGPEKMVLWDHQKLLNSIPHLYCPNPKCSAVVQMPEDTNDPQAICPFCHLLLCVPCRVAWHDGISCEQYQALPPDERSPEDRLLHELAKAKHWRRCPNCASLVELVSGCNHMTCRCGTHFCFKCGSLATTKGACTRVPQCALWDEEMLLEERERERERVANLVPPMHPPPAYNPAPAPFVPAINYPRQESLNWMDDRNIVCSRHPFTTDMISNLVCGYCNVRLSSLADLRFHLSRVRHHSVFCCCGRFFRRVQDYERHTDTYAARFGGTHVHQMRRD
ncbi:RBR-type E3 ubiquitin transferase [Mycena sanguinolenta]|uniref:RBR-type E3 ubiquitin transferase n=1 Tax=Mycena sanguinolenta TaxID=230812 RepID=A0A8H7CT17_9AGAR|nr:RBR-type E3 ubiquitin transferase [Mycena sanguinolenta]